jgi:hypothetical protein
MLQPHIDHTRLCPLLLLPAVAFHQRLAETHNVTPVAVHYTFQAKFDNAGKLSKARESNYYLRDAPEPPGSKYLTYQNSVEAWLGEVDALWQQQTGGQLVDLHKHLLAAGETEGRQADRPEGSLDRRERC